MSGKRLFNSVLLSALMLALIGGTSAADDEAPPKLSHVDPRDLGMDPDRLRAIDEMVAEGLARGEMPGCVVLIGHRGRIVFLKAYGDKQIEPSRVAMTTGTVFDMASITKPVATATSIMKLIEEEKLGLHDRVAEHIPEFGANGKESITVFHLLTHQGGLIPDNPLSDYDGDPQQSMQKIYDLKPVAEPGTKFIYTDVGYIVLAELVQRVRGQNIHEFSQQFIFQPLGMNETGFVPDDERRKRAAPTEKRSGEWIRGEVHDPRAWRLGGVAGHAGLFSTAEDLAVYAQMMLGGGEYHGRRIFKPETVALMTKSHPVADVLRGLGWDCRSGYSSNRGELFSRQAFGHGGFTGTVLWIDPELDLFVIFLSNRLHPNGKGAVNQLAGRIGTLAAAAVAIESSRIPKNSGAVEGGDVGGDGESARILANSATVLTGIDVLKRDEFAALKGRRVGLITNHTGINRQGVSTVDILHRAPHVELVALFSPEHGFRGKLDVPVIGDTKDPATGLPVYSLYGETRTPSAKSLKDLDTLVFDIQDVGARFYTYISTMGNAMKAAAEHKVRFVVLDRPNPINGVVVEGPVLDRGRESFVGFHPIAVRHGMTAGELAMMFREELRLDLDLQVIRLEHWRRGDYFDATGLLWVNPSPNMRSLTQAVLYPGIGLLETTNLSVGRGTDTPFEVIGAPWLDGVAWAKALNGERLPGVRFVPIRFTPTASKFAGEECGGVNVIVTDRRRFRPLLTGFTIAEHLRRLYPETWQAKDYHRLLADQTTLDALLSGRSAMEIVSGYREELDEFRRRREKHLLYTMSGDE